ncbi:MULTISPECIES: helix-turn-helix transcriptional regulator [Rhodopseudomonas]|uniref:Uncharacterized protein n=1 Tax=Rhodopseudomonas palustris TaxID=1076 RepID=A0A0D7EEI5_RHOPL|nr:MULTISPECIES: helix-turn-helix transcriptional regulator [Rhodopseudomonas]KIZ39061.1 hypothetical protein OO17_21625 [Rhodopseudomonas palustris]MDF3809288.1 helix-turn-helix transcriptional regulator [Rhodopseudomonas sp. BAL398]WOK19029.1 helix-turn-helix transcriptional regulator [Rhodopseudomonas sp. BAL398]
MFFEGTAIDSVHIPAGTYAVRSRTLPTKNSRSETKKAVQTRQRAWLVEVLEKTQLKPTQLAAGANITSTTLTRMLNNEDYSGTLSPETIERIKGAYKVPGPEEFSRSGRSPLIGFTEAARFDVHREKGELGRIVAAILHGHANMYAWRLKTMALEGVGYLSGDIVFVRMLEEGQSPRPQDAVCAHITDYQHGAAETVWRVFDPPFLVGAANDRTAYKPVLVDGDRVKIAGVIEQSYRPHALSTMR